MHTSTHLPTGLLSILLALAMNVAVSFASKAQATQTEQAAASTPAIQATTQFFAGPKPQSFLLKLRISISSGYHLYAPNPGVGGMAPRIEWSLPQGWQLIELRYPTPQVFSTNGGNSFGYENHCNVLVLLSAKPNAQLGAQQAALTAKINALICSDDECVMVRAQAEQLLPTADDPQVIADTTADGEPPAFPEALKIAATLDKANKQIHFSLPAELAELQLSSLHPMLDRVLENDSLLLVQPQQDGSYQFPLTQQAKIEELEQLPAWLILESLESTASTETAVQKNVFIVLQF